MAKASKHPQQLVRYQEICDQCGGVDTFRVRKAYGGGVYVRCELCGRTGYRKTLSAEHRMPVRGVTA